MYLIFDFDGTLVDSFDCLMEKFFQVSNQYHMRTLSSHEIARLRDLPSKEIIKQLKIPLYQLPGMLAQVRHSIQAEILNLKPVVHLFQVLEQLYDAGFTLGILSSNAKENVTAWLKHHQVEYLFKFIYMEQNFFSKGSVLKEILDVHQIEKNQAFYIGDETRDIEAAKANDICAVAVTWGFNSEKALAQTQPHFIARKPTDLLELCGISV